MPLTDVAVVPCGSQCRGGGGAAGGPGGGCGGGLGGCGGGGGMDSTPGAWSGQTSRTGQGAWSTTKRVAGPRLAGPRRERSPSRAATSRSASWAAWTTTRSTRPLLAWRRAARPSRAEPAGQRAGGGLGHLVGGDVEQGDLGVGGQQRPGGVDAALPGALDQPDQHTHRGPYRGGHRDVMVVRAA